MRRETKQRHEAECNALADYLVMRDVAPALAELLYRTRLAEIRAGIF